MSLIPGGIQAQLAPYALAIKAGIVGLVFLFGIGVGCSCQSKRDQSKVDHEIERTAEANKRAAQNAAQGQLLADQLSTITAATRAQADKAKAETARAKAEADAAAKEADAMRRRASKAEADIAKAMRNVDCNRQLEATSCAAIR